MFRVSGGKNNAEIEKILAEDLKKEDVLHKKSGLYSAVRLY